MTIQHPIDASVKNAKDVEMNAVLGATLVTEERGFSAELAVRPPKDFDHPAYGRVRLFRVAVSVTHFMNSPDPVKDPGPCPPYVRVSGYMHTLTATGEVSKREKADWRHLPRELAATLLGTAMLAREQA